MKKGRTLTKCILLVLTMCLLLGIMNGCKSTEKEQGAVNEPTDGKTEEESKDKDNTTTSTEKELENNVYTTGLPIVKDPITLKVAVVRQPGDQSSSTAVKPYAVLSEKDTNIKFDWLDLVTDVQTQISVMLAGDDMPDVFLGGLTQDIISQNYDLFAEVDELLPKYAPNVLAYYKDNNTDWEKLLTYPNGHIYSLMGGFYHSYQGLVSGIGWINKVWLDNAGLEPPKTTDDLYNVLKAFKDEDVDKNGDPNNEVPLDFAENYWCGSIRNYLCSWGITGFYNIENEKIVPTMDTDAYRAFLEYFNKLYKEGLINTEGFSQTGDQYIASNKAMLQGVFHMWAPQTNLEGSLASQYVPLGIIKAPGYEDKYVYPISSRMTANLVAFTISSKSKYIEAALRWWDYLSSTDEMRMLTARGVEGYVWERGEDGKNYLANPTPEEKTALIKKNGLAEEYNNTMTNASFYLDNFNPLIMENLSYYPPKEGEFASQGYARQGAIDILSDYVAKEEMPKTIVPPDKLEEFNFTCEGLEDYINSFMSKSIMEGVTDQSWEEYVNQLEQYNYDYYIDFYQKKFDGKFD